MEFRTVEQLAALPELAIFKKESQADFGWNSIFWDGEFAENLAIFAVLEFSKLGIFTNWNLSILLENWLFYYVNFADFYWKFGYGTVFKIRYELNSKSDEPGSILCKLLIKSYQFSFIDFRLSATSQ